MSQTVDDVAGLAQTATSILEAVRAARPDASPDVVWRELVDRLRSLAYPPAIYRQLWDDVFREWAVERRGPRPMWLPGQGDLEQANLTDWMRAVGMDDYREFHRWSVDEREKFWRMAIERLGIRFRRPPVETLDVSRGVPRARWLVGARMNIVESCFQADANQTAIIAQRPGGRLEPVSYGELEELTSRVARSLFQAGFSAGDAIAVAMPMTAMSVPIYLGIVAAGCTVVSIADSFAGPEIASRLRISGARAIFTYDVMVRSGKTIALGERVAAATAGTDCRVIVLPDRGELTVTLRNQDVSWQEFLTTRAEPFLPLERDASDPINILFSSGTTGDPKAIPWSHLTPLRAAVDGCLHQDIHPGHVVVWPTNLGWMMGPWLIFATLVNRATIGLFEDVPTSAEFGQFVEQAGVNVLGVVPTIVKAWRASQAMEGRNWTGIHTFSSTGETSHPEDYFYLSSLAAMRPVIEYCGGTEIGGAYITSTVVQPNAPSCFTTPAAGLDVEIIDAEGRPADEGELFIVGPSIGLSDRLLKGDHDATYYANTPTGRAGVPLRRHGDHFQRLPGGYYAAGGRVDDTMNLGGIKVSSVELERVLNGVPGVRETAAVAVADRHGPEYLVVYAVLESGAEVDRGQLLADMNARLKEQLNPLFRAQSVQIVDALPRTASNKVMRRLLREVK